jgi:hypothetical protein
MLASTPQITPHVLARARQVTDRLKPVWRHGHRPQPTRQQQPREQLGVLAIALNPITRRARRLRRRDHHHIDSYGCRSTRETEAGRSRLIRRTHRPSEPRQPLHHPLSARAEPLPSQLAAEQIDRR